MREDVLPTGTAAVASALAQWPTMSQFYLAGGTALALHLGHRQSRDLDFFTRDATGTLPPLVEVDDMLAHFAQVQWDLNTSEQVQWRPQIHGIGLSAPNRGPKPVFLAGVRAHLDHAAM